LCGNSIKAAQLINVIDISDLSVPINADSGPQSETQQRVVPRISASGNINIFSPNCCDTIPSTIFADKPSSSAAAASVLPQSHNQHVGATSSASGNWRIWKYECNDLPAKCPRCRAMIKNILRVSIDSNIWHEIYNLNLLYLTKQSYNLESMFNSLKSIF
jgi:hypothetical protein